MDLRYTILFTLVFTSLLCFGNTEFNRITIDDGLSSNRTYGAVQDSEGFIWISTDIGIDRFDGKNIVHYELDMHDEFSGMGYQFNRILIDNDDNIFLVNNRHFIYKLNRNTDSFDRIKSFEKLYGRYAFEALLDSHHNILIGTPSFVLKYNYDTDSITKSPSNLNLTSARSIIEFGQGYLVGINNKLLKVSYDLNSAEELGSWSPKYAKESRFNEFGSRPTMGAHR